MGGRWEWRTFGDLSGNALAHREPDRVENSDEVYVLTPASARSGGTAKGRPPPQCTSLMYLNG